jgi:hypothetical protein
VCVQSGSGFVNEHHVVVDVLYVTVTITTTTTAIIITITTTIVILVVAVWVITLTTVAVKSEDHTCEAQQLTLPAAE